MGIGKKERCEERNAKRQSKKRWPVLSQSEVLRDKKYNSKTEGERETDGQRERESAIKCCSRCSFSTQSACYGFWGLSLCEIRMREQGWQFISSQDFGIYIFSLGQVDGDRQWVCPFKSARVRIFDGIWFLANPAPAARCSSYPRWFPRGLRFQRGAFFSYTKYPRHAPCGWRSHMKSVCTIVHFPSVLFDAFFLPTKAMSFHKCFLFFFFQAKTKNKPHSK